MDFFSRLIERTQGIERPVQPRLAPLFAEGSALFRPAAGPVEAGGGQPAWVGARAPEISPAAARAVEPSPSSFEHQPVPSLYPVQPIQAGRPVATVTSPFSGVQAGPEAREPDRSLPGRSAAAPGEMQPAAPSTAPFLASPVRLLVQPPGEGTFRLDPYHQEPILPRPAASTREHGRQEASQPAGTWQGTAARPPSFPGPEGPAAAPEPVSPRTALERFDLPQPGRQLILPKSLQAVAASQVRGKNEVPPPDPPAPAIHIHIGRVEVRATMPPPSPASPGQAGQQAPRLSLDDYLRAQNGDKR
jgi:hypothetical protein